MADDNGKLEASRADEIADLKRQMEEMQKRLDALCSVSPDAPAGEDAALPGMRMRSMALHRLKTMGLLAKAPRLWWPRKPFRLWNLGWSPKWLRRPRQPLPSRMFLRAMRALTPDGRAMTISRPMPRIPLLR